MAHSDDEIDDIIMSSIANEEATHSANEQEDNEYSNENILTLPNISNWSDLVKVLPNIGSVAELKAWCREYIFREPFIRFYHGFVLPDQALNQQSRTRKSRGLAFDTILGIIQSAKKNRDRSLVRDNIPTGDWNEDKWLASTLVRIFEANEEDGQGIFDINTFNLKERQFIIFKLIQLARSELSPSRASRGWDTLGLSHEERLDILARYPHIHRRHVPKLSKDASVSSLYIRYYVEHLLIRHIGFKVE